MFLPSESSLASTLLRAPVWSTRDPAHPKPDREARHEDELEEVVGDDDFHVISFDPRSRSISATAQSIAATVVFILPDLAR